MMPKDVYVIKNGDQYLAYDYAESPYWTVFLEDAETYRDKTILDLDLKTYGGRQVRINIEECEE